MQTIILHLGILMSAGGEFVMKKKTANTMRAVGAVMAVGSAIAIMGAAKSENTSAKKTMKKTADKVVGFVDTVASLM